MTQREFFTKAIEIFNEIDAFEMAQFATERIAALDKRNEHRSTKKSATQIENEKTKEKILGLFESGNEVYVASDIGRKLEISTNKASALARQLVLENKLASSEVKIKGKGKVKGYSLITD